MSIGENIKHFRKQKKLTQGQLAELANMSRSYVADIERDRYNPSVDTLKTIAQALEIGTNLLLGENISTGTPQSSLSPKEERDIARDLEKMLSNLESHEAMSFYDGEPLDEESKELLRISLENSMRLAKQMAKKKFTPKKYRKEE
ncbi:helix-turn-helix transcriptional regulator [Pelosinus propionicus]|uniref:Helix-turn-helix n=1 Tax=Pelosinus propionicus DSM 13327 TaxID=1123291 RepID=A0A1I4QLB9_9FIRM|nr:helix-turn-helix transcriptional regulator [Pelosinus propionicus]SFM40510.1 Helix-turn-helix [Pelosinus propionicus DSM 13327]